MSGSEKDAEAATGTTLLKEKDEPAKMAEKAAANNGNPDSKDEEFEEF